MKEFVLKHLSTIIFSLILFINIFALIVSGEINNKIIFAKWDRNSIYLRRGYFGSRVFVIEPPNDISVRSVNSSTVKTSTLDYDKISREQKGIEGFQDFEIEVFGKKNVLKNLSFKEVVCDNGKRIRISQQQVVYIYKVIFPDLYSCLYYLRFSNEDVEPGKEYKLKEIVFKFANREFKYPLDITVIGRDSEEANLVVFRSEGEYNGVRFSSKNDEKIPFYSEKIENVTQADVEVLKIDIVGDVEKFVRSFEVSQKLPCLLKPGESLEYAFYDFLKDREINWIIFAPRVTYKIRGDSKVRYYYPGTGKSKMNLSTGKNGEVFPKLFFQEINLYERSN